MREPVERAHSYPFIALDFLAASLSGLLFPLSSGGSAPGPHKIAKVGITRRPAKKSLFIRGFDGGRTRARTLDPLIKSQLVPGTWPRACKITIAQN
jgi:hypothetical protein